MIQSVRRVFLTPSVEIPLSVNIFARTWLKWFYTRKSIEKKTVYLDNPGIIWFEGGLIASNAACLEFIYNIKVTILAKNLMRVLVYFWSNILWYIIKVIFYSKSYILLLKWYFMISYYHSVGGGAHRWIWIKHLPSCRLHLILRHKCFRSRHNYFNLECFRPRQNDFN